METLELQNMRSIKNNNNCNKVQTAHFT